MLHVGTVRTQETADPRCTPGGLLGGLQALGDLGADLHGGLLGGHVGAQLGGPFVDGLTRELGPAQKLLAQPRRPWRNVSMAAVSG